MDGILNDEEDFNDFFDLPNAFSDDILLDDLDSLDFINDLEENSIYDCNIETLNPNQCQQIDNTQNYSKILSNVGNNNYFRNNVPDRPFSIFNNNSQIKESSPLGNTMIRELLSSDNNTKPSPFPGTYMTLEKNNLNNTQNSSNNVANLNIRTTDHRKNTSKQYNILPATPISSGHVSRNSTLAATLIGIQQSSSSNDNIYDENCSFSGGGKVVRRNSHNAIEKRYRLSINDRIDELRQMLALGDSSKMNKSAVLRKAVERIRFLEQENNSLKCENYNLRKSFSKATSNESLNQTGSSPLSAHSDGGNSVNNSPSSSSMHSTSVASSSLFYKNNENQSCILNNSNKGVKRPLIYDNTITPVKTEKLARLLLSSADACEVKHSGFLKEIQTDHGQARRSQSSNIPGFLMCTMALFIVAFQPLEVILNNYRLKPTSVTRGRTILQMSESNDSLIGGLGRTIFLVVAHWILAFILVWGSSKNKSVFTKFGSFIFQKTQSLTFIAMHYNNVHNCDHVDKVEETLSLWSMDPETFKLNLNGQLSLYNCHCPTNIVMYFIQLFGVVFGVIISYLPFYLSKRRPDKVALSIRMCLVRSAVEQSILGGDTSRLQNLWYKAVLILLIRHGECNGMVAWSKIILFQTISLEFIRKHFVNKTIKAVLLQNNASTDKYCRLLNSVEIQKILIKNPLKKIKEKMEFNTLLPRMKGEVARGYYLAYVDEMVAVAVKKILTHEVNFDIKDFLKEVIYTSSIILEKAESSHIQHLCSFIISAKERNKSQNVEEFASKLIEFYYGMISKSKEDIIKNDLTQLVYTINLFLSTRRLFNGDEIEVHEVNLDLIKNITKTSISKFFTRLIFEMSLDNIISSLNDHGASLTRSSCYIYYADLYNEQLVEYSDSHTGVFGKVIKASKFEILFQNLCQVNPIKSGIQQFEDKERLKSKTYCYRVTEVLSSERRRLSECNNTKMRSH